MSNPKLTYALKLAALGYYPFPLVRGTKMPRKGSNGFKDATREEAQIRVWFENNPGSDIGIACSASGITVFDIDSKGGAHPDEVIPKLELNGCEPAQILTGTAGPPTKDHPDSLKGVRGAQLVFRGRGVPTAKASIPGCEFRGELAYVVAPGSLHPNGDYYEGILPPVADLPELPPQIRALVQDSDPRPLDKDGRRVGSLPPIPEDVPRGQRHKLAHDYALSLRRKGFHARAIAAALREQSADWTEPLPDDDIVAIAENKERRFPVTHPPRVEQEARFSIVRADYRQMRKPRFSWEGRYKTGATNLITGVGSVGKSTLEVWVATQLSLGRLPGCYLGEPTASLIIGDEDSIQESWLPKFNAARGDTDYIYFLNQDDGVPLDLERDVTKLKSHVTAHGITQIYFDAILDHVPSERNANQAPDVRRTLAKLRAVAVELDLTVKMSQHPNKRRDGGDVSFRDRAGQSGQWTDYVRSALLLGYHPEHGSRADGEHRCFVRGKGNIGREPAAFMFTIQETFVRVPGAGETFETVILGDIGHDENIAVEDVKVHRPVAKSQEPTKDERIKSYLKGMGWDGKWRSRRAAEGECQEKLDVGERTFARAFSTLVEDETIELRNAGGNAVD
jgi:Bifunctional DNA primase/polymerase, N-terminal/AAA domain